MTPVLFPFALSRKRGVWGRDAGDSEIVGHAPNCIMVEVINQSGACIFLQFELEGIVARGMKGISLRGKAPGFY